MRPTDLLVVDTTDVTTTASSDWMEVGITGHVENDLEGFLYQMVGLVHAVGGGCYCRASRLVRKNKMNSTNKKFSITDYSVFHGKSTTSTVTKSTQMKTSAELTTLMITARKG